ncbi:hypothetical protein MGYG_08780 [Nannizzia gypsea CBS 118893]|uniref:Uncharacterized protein n=1 Tax=Arthroderma gypseum (strain ATCC MYA-4604 / CBS 118893) TaxID=535722 RepID=E4V6Z4_ARTGP|nr:hypothetical protein MGYG_08780 [Nannizzia gypsea CBS 118893]EFQ96860.1 hypothetical protein MGYG_08780 [Nannizzia gypsea CBS 118893]
MGTGRVGGRPPGLCKTRSDETRGGNVAYLRISAISAIWTACLPRRDLLGRYLEVTVSLLARVLVEAVDLADGAEEEPQKSRRKKVGCKSGEAVMQPRGPSVYKQISLDSHHPAEAGRRRTRDAAERRSSSPFTASRRSQTWRWQAVSGFRPAKRRTASTSAIPAIPSSNSRPLGRRGRQVELAGCTKILDACNDMQRLRRAAHLALSCGWAWREVLL